MNLSGIRERVAIDAIRLAPKSMFSGFVGWGARRTLPKRLRAPLYEAFANAVGAQLDEVEHALDSYPSFGSFFARGLRPDARPLASDPTDWIAPCDSYVAEMGPLSGREIVAKGRSFSPSALLASDALAKELESGQFATLYLSPRDYHRVHAPTDCSLVGYHYVPGSLFPVKPFFVEHIDNLFAMNERVVLQFESPRGPFALVMVAAAGVGNIRLDNPPVEGRFFRAKGQHHSVTLSTPIAFERGQLLGAFELGSTVILCTSAQSVTFSAQIGENLLFGASIGNTRRGGNE